METSEITIVYLLLAMYSMTGLFIAEIARIRKAIGRAQINREIQYYPRSHNLKELDIPEWPGTHFPAFWAIGSTIKAEL